MLVCTAVYEAGRPFVGAWCDSINEAAGRYEGPVSVLLLIDGLADARRSYAAVSAHLPVQLVEPGPMAGVAMVRREMLAAARATECDAFVFVDMDDVAEPDCLNLHRDALADADASYGDARVIGDDGAEIAASFFADCDVPTSVDSVDPLRRRNFMGLTNTAARRDRVPAAAYDVPVDVMAVDWWFYSTLLITGRRAKRTRAAVSGYRRHGGSMIGSGHAATAAGLARRCDVVAAHCRRFGDDAVMREFGHRAAGLRDEVRREPRAAERHLSRLSPRPFVWHEDVWRLTSEGAVQ
ncbi:MAG: hypothetical protein EXR87_07280 [Gammaproteobacteria bacterium]|nr:hypothetical protein [Gammaproteobacteria bacterium]